VKPPKRPAQRSAAKPTGRSAVPQHLEAGEHELRPDACAHCASTDLHVVDVVVEEKLHVVKEHQRRRKVHRKTCRCRKCGKRTTARSLPAPYARFKGDVRVARMARLPEVCTPRASGPPPS
jgi:hypothetical protein